MAPDPNDAIAARNKMRRRQEQVLLSFTQDVRSIILSDRPADEAALREWEAWVRALLATSLARFQSGERA